MIIYYQQSLHNKIIIQAKIQLQQSWREHYLMVDTVGWWSSWLAEPGKKILPIHIQLIDHTEPISIRSTLYSPYSYITKYHRSIAKFDIGT